MKNPAIETTGLRKRYEAQTAVRDLSLSVAPGEVFGFLGPNGAGKTTSVKMLLGLVHPTSGEGRLLGAPLGDVATRARVGYLPEHFRFHEWLTGRQLLRMHGRLSGVPSDRLEQRIDALLGRLELTDAAQRRVRHYSKGMRQRIGLAQALVGDPELVFLDEPTSGLDPLGRLLVRDVIRELRARGATVFLNSHLLSEVEVTCDRVAFIRRGSIVRELDLGSDDEGLEVTLRVDASPDGLEEELRRFGREVSVRDGPIHLRVESESVLPELTRWLAGRGIGIYELTRRPRSLEEVFLEVMEHGEGAPR